MPNSPMSIEQTHSPVAHHAGSRYSHSFVDSETILRINNLELRAKVIVEGFMAGLHRSPYHGFSVEFTDYRQYSPGDDLRHLDWKLLARQDRLYIKRFEDETNLRCYLLVDLSHSMSFRTGALSKAEYAKTAAATLAYFLSLQRDAVGMTTFEEHLSDVIPPRYRPGHLRRLMMCLEKSPQGKSTNIHRPFEQVAQTATKRGLIVLISDLLTPAEDVTKHLGYLRSLGHDVILLRILDPAEIQFEFETAAIFEDLETGQQLHVDPQSVAETYRKRFADHEQRIMETCNLLGIDYFRILTSDPFESALFDLIHARHRVGPGPRRANPPGVRR